MISAIILLRSGSSRLPQKHSYNIGDETIINIILKKLLGIRGISEIVIATGIKKENSLYEKLIIKNKKIRFYYHHDNSNVTERINEVVKGFK